MLDTLRANPDGLSRREIVLALKAADITLSEDDGHAAHAKPS